VYVNRLLERDGWLVLDGPADALSSLNPELSRAYALDPGRLYLNLRGREPRGCVDKNDYERVRADLETWARELPWAEDVIVQEQAFSGPHAHKGPDLVILPKRGFDPKGSLRSKSTEGKGSLSGMHTQDGAFVFVAGERPPARPVPVESVGVTALALLGLDVSGFENSPLVG
jgi:predicted AlkP superfamily phosphohydrolase/phosphomutase